MLRSALLLLLAGCVPTEYPELEPWPDLRDLRDGRYMAGDVDFELPWSLPLDEVDRPKLDPHRELIHACVLLPLSGEHAEAGGDALKAALLAVEEREQRAPGTRQVLWHVEDTQAEPRRSVTAAQECQFRQALVLAGPLLDRQVNEVVPAMSGHGLTVIVPEPGAAGLEKWDARFVAVGPPAPAMGEALAEHAAATLPAGVTAALVPAQGIGPPTAERWMARLERSGWRRGPVTGLSAADPSVWPQALRDAADQGASAVLIAGGVPAAASLLPVLKEKPALQLWLIDAASQVEFVKQAAHEGVLDRIHFTLRRWPARDFRRAFAKRWGQRPLHASASVYEAVRMGYAAAETTEFLSGPDLGNAARRLEGPSAWGEGARSGEVPLDYASGAGYDVAVAVQGTPESGGIWTFVPVQDAAPPATPAPNSPTEPQ